QYGIMAIPFKELLSNPIPKPTEVEVFLAQLEVLAKALREREERIKTIEGDFEVIDVKKDYRLKGLNRKVDLIIHLKKSGLIRSKTTWVIASYIGEVNLTTMTLFVEEIGKVTASQDILAYLGFIVKSATKEDVKEFNKVKGNIPVCLIVADRGKIYGNQEAKPFFDLQSYIKA
ncbi:MAG: hypothetical protein J7K59_00730, partial [Candidatus Korarchaeota archaeon]|nr:hypothetical protein [Candidatus Korarchaeota archaeon]